MNRSHIVDVIGYTVVENLKKKSIFVTTILVTLVCILAVPIIAYISLEGNKANKDDESKIKKVYIYDATEFENIGYENLISMEKDYKNMDIEYSSIYDFENNKDVNNDSEDTNDKNPIAKKQVLTKTAIRKFSEKINKCIKENKGESCVIVHITHVKFDNKTNKKLKDLDGKIDDNITIDMTIPRDSKLKKSSVNILGNYINQLITMKKYELSAKDEGELLELMAGVNVSINTIGKGEDNHLLSMIKMFVPVICSMIMYFMLMTYGQSLCNGMITEKNSKIIELLVAHIRPRNLIIGKVLGNVIIAVGQILIWAAALLVGIKCANVYAVNLNGKVFIDVHNIIELIKDENIGSAFSISAIIISIIILLMGFLFYCIYAAICGSFINKPDEASSVFAVYTYTNVVAFLAVYMGTFMEKKSLVAVARYIPFCTPYSVPADVLIGEISISRAMLIILIMLACIVVIINVLGNVYERLVFNQLSVKELIKNRKI